MKENSLQHTLWKQEALYTLLSLLFPCTCAIDCKATFTLIYLMCSGASSGTEAILALNGFFCKLSYALRGGDYV